MLTTTFNKLKEAKAYLGRYEHLARALDLPNYGKDTPITFLQILEANGLDDTLWAFCAAVETEDAQRIGRLFAADCAEHVLHIFEKSYPEDKRPHHAIEVARRYAVGQATDEEMDAARAAALAAAGVARAAARTARFASWGASWGASEAAAWAAAGVARAENWAVKAAGDASAAKTAGDAAWCAAWCAEKEWQKQKLIQLLTEGEEQ